ncbi:hypothetical protein EON64_05065 [archaeon]|nr:MAG: hypothetical protein EON64_05065 [archaeon]
MIQLLLTTSSSLPPSLMHRSYHVYRGITVKTHLSPSADPQGALQTWSAGKRFATVPLHVGNSSAASGGVDE